MTLDIWGRIIFAVVTILVFFVFPGNISYAIYILFLIGFATYDVMATSNNFKKKLKSVIYVCAFIIAIVLLLFLI